MKAEHFDILLDYNDWANEQVLDAAARLSRDAYNHDFGQAWGSVRGTLTHLYEVDQLWLRRWEQGDAPVAHDIEAFDTLDDLREAWLEVMEARRVFINGLKPGGLDQQRPYTNSKDEAYAEPLWQQLFHVINHGTDHRGQISTMLTELGVQHPELDFIFWARGINWQPDISQEPA